MTQATGWGPDHTFVLPDGRTGWWVRSAPADKPDSERHMVKAKDPRGWISDPEGGTTKASHGRSRKYYCVPCMAELGAPDEPKRWW